MENQDLVSIIVPNYNHASFLKERLESIFNQTYGHYEVILLDDASTDGSQKFKIHSPLIELTKAGIIKAGMELGVDYSMTHSCYEPVGDLACGQCDACLLRRKGFSDAGVPDPTRYA